MNREELDHYLDVIYTQGYNVGVVEMSNSFAAHVEEGIKRTPGVGEKKTQAIMDNIAAVMNETAEHVQQEADNEVTDGDAEDSENIEASSVEENPECDGDD